jgi:hypothetical protein
MNIKVICLILGLVAGALGGYVTRPESAEIKLPGVNIEVTGTGTASGNGALTSDQLTHIGIFALIGGIVGLGVGFIAGRGRA